VGYLLAWPWQQSGVIRERGRKRECEQLRSEDEHVLGRGKCEGGRGQKGDKRETIPRTHFGYPMVWRVDEADRSLCSHPPFFCATKFTSVCAFGRQSIKFQRLWFCSILTSCHSHLHLVINAGMQLVVSDVWKAESSCI
jgi:hypothetical protein